MKDVSHKKICFVQNENIHFKSYLVPVRDKMGKQPSSFITFTFRPYDPGSNLTVFDLSERFLLDAIDLGMRGKGLKGKDLKPIPNLLTEIARRSYLGAVHVCLFQTNYRLLNKMLITF